LTTDPSTLSRKFELKWDGCTRCHLGTLRNARTIVDVRRMLSPPRIALGQVVPTPGLLFVVEPAGESEEATGTPGTHSKYKPIHNVMAENKEIPYAITHSLACRCCALILGANQAPLLDKYGVQRVRDVEPQKISTDACRERLHEEVYLRDPFLIIALGTGALRALNPRAADLSPGKMYPVPILGMTKVPALTPKGVWGRKAKGQMVYPMKPNVVEYRALLGPSMRDVQTYGASEDIDREKMVLVRCLQRALSMWKLREKISREA